MTSFGLLSLLHEQEGLCWVWHCVYCSGHKALVKHEQVQYQNRKRVHKNCFAGPLTPRKRWMGVWIRNCTLMRHFPWGGGVRRVTVHLRVNTAQTLIFWCPATQPRQLPWRTWPSGSHWQRRPSPSQWPGVRSPEHNQWTARNEFLKTSAELLAAGCGRAWCLLLLFLRLFNSNRSQIKCNLPTHFTDCLKCPMWHPSWS